MLWQFKPSAGGGSGVTDHGALTGLADDDHPQYHNDARGDARYNTKAEITTALAGKANTSHTHVAANITDFAATVRSTVLTGFVAAGTRAAIAATDTLLVALGKVQKYLNDLSALAFSGNASDLAGTKTSAFISDFNSASRAQTEAELIAGTNITITPAGSGAARTLTIAASGGGGGSPVTVRDEGTDITTALSILNFTGAGVTVTGGATATVDIPGGGGGSTNLSYAIATRLLESSSGTDVVLPPDSSPARLYAFNDMLTTTNNPVFTFGQAGTGAGVAHASMQDGGVGWTNVALGTTATGRVNCSSGTNAFRLGLGRAAFAARVRQLALSDATTTFTQRFGFLNSVTGESPNGVFFRYTHSVNGGRWEAVTRSGGVETAVDTGITVAINTTYKLEIEVNAAGTSAEFRIDGTLVATIPTNIPNIATREVGVGMMILRSVGTTASTPISLDYLQVEQTLTAAR